MPLQIPHPNAPLHLYRHILREATYLPPVARPWTFEHIKSSFRRCQTTQNPKRYIKVAHRRLRFLRAANAGHIPRLLRICHLATGRLGKRRRQLAIEHLSMPAGPESGAVEEPTGASLSPDAMRRLSAAAFGKPEKVAKAKARDKLTKKALPPVHSPSWLEGWDLEKVRILAESQYSHQEEMKAWVKENKVRRTVDPRLAVERENCWGNTFKPKQITTKLKKHWKSVLKSLMPPLPQREWNTLKALAEGTASEDLWKMPSRRPVAKPMETQGSSANSEALWDWEQYATFPIRCLERKNSRKKLALSGSSDDNPNYHGRPIGVRVPKARFLKRSIYSRVWQAAPLLTEASSDKWAVTWGNSGQKVTTSKPLTSDLQFFQGVDKKGKILS